MRIAICDDSTTDITKIKQLICHMADYSFDFDVYISSLELIRCLHSGLRYDLYLLDIEMPEKSGISLARKIRELDTKALLVFLTSYTKYMKDVFEVVTFDYIMKPLSDEKLSAVIDKAFSYLNMTNQSFSFSYRKNRYSLKFDEILYLEKRGRQAIIHTMDRCYQTNMNISELWEQLDDKMFAAIHGSFIINLKHIKTMVNGIVSLTDGTELVVTRGYRKSLSKKHLTFVRGGM